MKNSFQNITLIVTIVLFLSFTNTLANTSQDSVLVSVDDIRTTIIVFAERDACINSQYELKKMVSRYELIVVSNDSIQDNYKFILSNMENIIDIKDKAHKLELDKNKEKLKKANKRFYISSGIGLILLLLLL